MRCTNNYMFILLRAIVFCYNVMHRVHAMQFVNILHTLLYVERDTKFTD